MNGRAQRLAEEFERVNGEVIMLVEGCSAADWRARCAREGWTVGVVAHHIANGYDQEGTVARLVRAVTRGQPLPPPPPPGYNEHHAARHADCTREETAALLRRNGAAGAALIRALSDAEIDRTFQSPRGGPPRALQQLIEQIFTTHARGHLASIRETLDDRRGSGAGGMRAHDRL